MTTKLARRREKKKKGTSTVKAQTVSSASGKQSAHAASTVKITPLNTLDETLRK